MMRSAPVPALGMVFLSAVLTAAIPEPVRTDLGLLTGVPGKDPSVRVFKGIPFAAPPVGDNRWRAPQPAQKWEGVRAADQFGPSCTAGAPGRGGKGGAPKAAPAQAKGKGGGAAQPAASEDCLYLNIWTAAQSANERRPVFVWNYGGGFTGGSSSLPGYDGEALAKRGLVVVTYNYRLGVFGFMAHPELTAESGHNASGNWALMDLEAALRWIQRNIAQFGGDPNRVTIAGESAGAVLVAAMVGSPHGKGLFHRAIAQSGAWMGLNIARMRTRQQAEEAAVRAAGGRSLAELRATPAAELALSGVQAGIIVDGWMVPEDQSVTYRAGRQNTVDVLIGSNKDEGTFFGGGGGNAGEFIAQAQQRYGDLAAEFLRLYPAGTNEEAAASGLARQRDEIGWHMRTWAQLQTKAGRKAYLYYFTRAAPGQEARGATHTAELPYMFGNPPANNSWTGLDYELAGRMTSYWANFAATGDPNGRGLPLWPPYDASKNDAQAMVLGDRIELGPQIEAARLAFFDKVYARQ